MRTSAPTVVPEQAREAARGVLAALPSWVQGSRHRGQAWSRSRRVPERTGAASASSEKRAEGEEGVCGCCCGGGGGGYMEEEEEEEEEDYGSEVEIEGALGEDEEDEEIDEDGDEEGDDDVLDNVLPDDLDSEVGGPHADGDAMEVRIAV